MFKFMKSKKGFTLVELMIVVVIMAILVAVAVPIYNAVTENARKKTCASNRRNIISQITNNAMSDPSILNAAALKAEAEKSTPGSLQFSVVTNGEGDDVDTASLNAEAVFSSDSDFLNLFNTKNRPICPVANGELTISVTPVKGDYTSLNVTVDCTGAADHDA
jgi:prepilin-type N-terminal cleavage/methylation domain-containing protein